MPTLTPKQKQILSLIVNYYNLHGFAPSCADIARQLQISRTTVHQHFIALERKGFLSHTKNVSRSWQVNRNYF